MWGKIEKSGRRFKMPTGPGHYFARPTDVYRWGEPNLILFLMNLSTLWPYRTHKFGIGDLAHKDPAQPVKGHVSHNGGNAVDLYIIHKAGLHRYEVEDSGKNDFEVRNRVTYHDQYMRGHQVFTDERYDADKTQMLARYIAWFSLTFPMIEVLYNDPKVQQNTAMTPRILTDLDKRRIKATQGKPYPNIWQHDDHIHCLLQLQKARPQEWMGLIKYWVQVSGIDVLIKFIEEGLGFKDFLRLNARDEKVETLQFALNLHGQSTQALLAEDGIFGNKTLRRVVEFQTQQRLSPDGIVGPKTKAALARGMTAAKLG